MTSLPVATTGGTYSLTTALTVPREQLQGNEFVCRAQHAATGADVKETIGGDGVCLVVTPKVTLLSDPTQEDPERRVLLVCLVEGLPSAGAAIQWLQDNEEMTPAPESDESGCSDCTESGVTQWSRVNVTRKSWEGGARFGCRVTHEGLKEPLSATVRNECGVTPQLQVSLLPPTLEELLVSHNATVTCVVSNAAAADGVSVSWSRSSGGGLDVSQTEDRQADGRYTVRSFLRVCAEEWNGGETFGCSVREEGVVVAEESIRKETDTPLHAPSVYVFPPPAEELSLQETATLTCMASSFLPSSILLTWTQQNQPISPQNYLIFGPEKDGDFYSLYSKLEVSVEDWQRGDVFGCVVGHDGIPLNFIHKSIDKNADLLCIELMGDDEEHGGDLWAAVTFAILFLLSLLYGAGLTLVKVPPLVSAN